MDLLTFTLSSGQHVVLVLAVASGVLPHATLEHPALRLPISPSGHVEGMDLLTFTLSSGQHVVLVLAVAPASCLSRHSSILLFVYPFRHSGMYEDGHFSRIKFKGLA